MIRPGRGANLRDWAKHGIPELEGYLAGQQMRLAEPADARVVDAVTSGKRLVNLPVRSPVRPPTQGLPVRRRR